MSKFDAQNTDPTGAVDLVAVREAALRAVKDEVDALHACGAGVTLGGMMSLLYWEGALRAASFNTRCSENSYNRTATDCDVDPEALYSYQFGLGAIHTSNFHPCKGGSYTQGMRQLFLDKAGAAGFPTSPSLVTPALAARFHQVCPNSTPTAVDYYLLGAHEVFGIPKNTAGNDLAAVGAFPLFTASVSVGLTFHELAGSCATLTHRSRRHHRLRRLRPELREHHAARSDPRAVHAVRGRALPLTLSRATTRARGAPPAAYSSHVGRAALALDGARGARSMRSDASNRRTRPLPRTETFVPREGTSRIRTQRRMPAQRLGIAGRLVGAAVAHAAATMTPTLQTLFRCSLAVLTATFSTGCATLMSSKTASYSIDSSPSGAEVRVGGQSMGRTPVTIQVDKSKPADVEVSIPGFGSQKCQPKTSIGAGYVAADLALCAFMFPIGCLSFIDAGGAWNGLDDTSCHVNLSPAMAFQQPGYPQQGFPQGYPQPGYPPQGFPQQAYPQAAYPQQGYPQPAAYPPPGGYPQAAAQPIAYPPPPPLPTM